MFSHTCHCRFGFPDGLCPSCHRPEPFSAEGLASLALSVERFRRYRMLRRQDPSLLMELLAESAFRAALCDRREQVVTMVVEGLKRLPAASRSQAFVAEVGRLAHLCFGWNDRGLGWMARIRAVQAEWGEPGTLARAYEALFLARAGRRQEALAELAGLDVTDRPVLELLVAEALIWCDREGTAQELLETLLRGRRLDEEYRHLAYLLMIDCLGNLGRLQEQTIWLRRERDWARRHGRRPQGRADAGPVEAAAWIADSARRARPADADRLGSRIQRLGWALDSASEADSQRLLVCTSHPLLEVAAVERLAETDSRATLEFAALFRELLPVGGLLLCLGNFPEGVPRLLQWLDDAELGPYAQWALWMAPADLLERRARHSPGSPGSVRATVALGSVCGGATVLLRLLEVPELVAPAALGLADAGGSAALRGLEAALAGSSPEQRQWLVVSRQRLLEGRPFRCDWRQAFRADPARRRQRLLSHPVDDLLRGHAPVEDPPASPGRPDPSWLRRELERWDRIGVSDPQELHSVLEWIDLLQPEPARGLCLSAPPGGGNPFRLLAAGVRRSLWG